MTDYNKLFEKQRELIESQLMPGELYKHCIDGVSFGGRYNVPCWVLTSEGRVWSLWSTGRWIKICLEECGIQNAQGDYKQKKYCVHPSKPKPKIWIHQLVANYFCDKSVVELYGEENVEVHHKESFDPKKTNEENNHAGNLQYILKPDHKEINRIVKSGTFRTKDSSVEADERAEEIARTVEKSAKAGFDVKQGVTYDESGNATYHVNVIPAEWGRILPRI